jgi:hypothetical protein
MVDPADPKIGPGGDQSVIRNSSRSEYDWRSGLAPTEPARLKASKTERSYKGLPEGDEMLAPLILPSPLTWKLIVTRRESCSPSGLAHAPLTAVLIRSK